jgi:hypothetical protein
MEHFGQDTTRKPSESVREIESQVGAVLLDIRQGLCLSMTPVGMMIWHRLKLNETGCQIAEYLAGQFRDVSRQKIQSDVVEFLAELWQKGLLVSRGGAGGPRPPRLLALLRPRQRKIASVPSARCVRFLVWKALFGLLACDLFRFGTDFARIHTSVQTWPVGPWLAPSDATDRVCRAMNYACIWYPKRVLCLQRSAVTTCLLRNCGVAAQMVIGAQKLPFEAHAWTETGGQPINEPRDVQSLYLVWERC